MNFIISIYSRSIDQCKMNDEKCKIKEETPLGVSKIDIFKIISLELHQ